MKKAGTVFVIMLALIMMTGLSVLYWLDVGEKVVTASTSVDGREIPVCRVEREKLAVALTFEAVSQAQGLEQILETLGQHQVKASFFVTGEWMESNAEGVRKILENGHDLGSMMDSGENMTGLSESECRSRIMKFHNQVKETFGYEMDLLRIPYGAYDNSTLRVIYACGYYPIGWSVDSADWKNYGTAQMIQKVCDIQKLQQGEIVRFHLGTQDSTEGLEQVLTFLEDESIPVLPVSELICKENYTMRADGTQVMKKSK